MTKHWKARRLPPACSAANPWTWKVDFTLSPGRQDVGCCWPRGGRDDSVTGKGARRQMTLRCFSWEVLEHKRQQTALPPLLTPRRRKFLWLTSGAKGHFLSRLNAKRTEGEMRHNVPCVAPNSWLVVALAAFLFTAALTRPTLQRIHNSNND